MSPEDQTEALRRLHQAATDHAHLRDALERLADASELFASSDPLMASHKEAEDDFESALAHARAVLGHTNRDERPTD